MVRTTAMTLSAITKRDADGIKRAIAEHNKHSMTIPLDLHQSIHTYIIDKRLPTLADVLAAIPKHKLHHFNLVGSKKEYRYEVQKFVDNFVNAVLREHPGHDIMQIAKDQGLINMTDAKLMEKCSSYVLRFTFGSVSTRAVFMKVVKTSIGGGFEEIEISLSDKKDGKYHKIFGTDEVSQFGMERQPHVEQMDEWKGEIRTLAMIMSVVYNVCRVWLVIYILSGGIIPIIEVLPQRQSCSYGHMKEFVTKLMAYVYRVCGH